MGREQDLRREIDTLYAALDALRCEALRMTRTSDLTDPEDVRTLADTFAAMAGINRRLAALHLDRAALLENAP